MCLQKGAVVLIGRPNFLDLSLNTLVLLHTETKYVEILLFGITTRVHSGTFYYLNGHFSVVNNKRKSTYLNCVW